MGFRFRKSIGSGPFRINISKSGVGYSIGSKGFRFTKKAGGGTRTTTSIPGTGISYVTDSSTKKRGSTMKQSATNTKNRNTQVQTSDEVLTVTFRPVSVTAASIKKLAQLNPDWKRSDIELLADGKPGQRIYQCKFNNTPVQLVPEPENAQNPNAIAVLVAGEKIGYVGPDNQAQIAEILKQCDVKHIACGIFGGQYKVIGDDYTISTQKCAVSITIRVGYAQKHAKPAAVSGRHKTSAATPSTVSITELLLCLFLGWVGAHKFYQKKKGMGILYLLTAGLFCIGWWGDAIQMILSFFGKSKKNILTRIGSYILAFVLALVVGSCGPEAEPAADPTIPTDSAIVTTEGKEATETPTQAPTEPIETEAATEPVVTAAPTEAPTKPAETEAPTEAPTEPAETEKKGTTYVLNTNTKKFHYASCSSAKKIKDSNRDQYTGTREEVIAMGYEPCGNCHP